MRYLTIFYLKIIDLLAMKSLAASLLLMPLIFGMIAGTANIANRQPDVRLALIDLDQTPASQALQEKLADQGWYIQLTDKQTAMRLLGRKQIDGLVTIEQGYDQSFLNLQESAVFFHEAEGSLVTSVVKEAVAAAVLPAHAEKALSEKAKQIYTQNHVSIPADYDALFSEKMAAYASGKANLQVDYIGSIRAQPTLTFVVSDYSMEIFFLSIYAIMGGLALTSGLLRKRLASTSSGLLTDYALSQLALFILGTLQIVLYTTVMSAVMGTAFYVSDIFYLIVFLILMLGISQLLLLIETSLRLYLSLLIMLILAIAGGCFFQLSEMLLRKVGQYTPHGWVLAAIKGYPVLHPLLPLLLAVILLFFGYWLQTKRAYGSPDES